MKNKKFAMAIAVGGIVVVALAAFMAIGWYSRNNAAKSSIIVQYYRALAADDTSAIAELASKDFSDQLGITGLKRGSYELYDLGESPEGALQFIIVVTGDKGEKRAILADMTYVKKGMQRQIGSIRLVDQGDRLKE
jgi:hypothetical protein